MVCRRLPRDDAGAWLGQGAAAKAVLRHPGGVRQSSARRGRPSAAVAGRRPATLPARVRRSDADAVMSESAVAARREGLLAAIRGDASLGPMLQGEQIYVREAPEDAPLPYIMLTQTVEIPAGYVMQ